MHPHVGGYGKGKRWKNVVGKMMGLREAFKKKRAKSNTSFVLSQPDAFGTLCTSGYRTLAHNPEIITAVNRIAELVSSMTIRLMQNVNGGDKRVNNNLSRHIDIEPNKHMTRKTLVHNIVRTLLLDGNGNQITIPKTNSGLIGDLIPVPPSSVCFTQNGDGYMVYTSGEPHDPNDLLHFVLNPNPERPWEGEGYRVALRDIADNLKQEAETKKGFLSSEWKPSLIVKVDAAADAFASVSGREKLLNEYIKTNKAGEPWIVPGEQIQIEQVKPLSLKDLALPENVILDKKTVAAIIGVPQFVLGVGAFSADEWNNFIDSKIMPICKAIEQELTRKLLTSPDMHFSFNPRSLYAYNLKDMAEVGTNLYQHGLAIGNEVRDWVGMSPIKGLDKLVILENYIPIEKIGDQKKLKGGDENE